MNLLIMGLPGAGKGTQAVRIAEEFKVLHISTGDMFRTAISSKTATGLLAKAYVDAGDLVPEEVTNSIVQERLAKGDVKTNGFVLDGYPRTIEQVYSLDRIFEDMGIKLDGVINLEVQPDGLLQRLSGRIVHRETGKTFHTVFNPPAESYNKSDFYQRDDDEMSTAKRRLEVDIDRRKHIIDYYRTKDLVHDVDGNQTVLEVFEDIKNILNSLRVEKQ